MKPAPLGLRIGAAIIDFLIVNIACTVLLIPFFYFFDFENRLVSVASSVQQPEFMNDPDPAVLHTAMMFVLAVLVLCLAFILIYHSYYIYFESSASGQTPGKKVLGLKVVSLDGGRITKRQAVIRELLRWYVDSIFFVPAFISIYSTVRRQRVGDVLAKTMVVEIPKQSLS